VTVSDNGNVIKLNNRNSVTDSGMWVGHEKHCIRNTLKVKRSKVKVARSCDVVAQKHRIYPITSLGIVEIHLSYRKSRSPEQMAGSDFRPEAPKLTFLCTCSENMPKIRLSCCQIATILAPL